MEIKIITDSEKNKRKEFWDKVEKGEKVKAEEKILYLTPQTFAKTFSPERIKLVIAVKQNKIESISQLAKLLNRPFESVHRDVKYLEGLNLIRLEKHEKMMVPIVQRSISFVL
jgi:predicted transcriptional regulator